MVPHTHTSQVHNEASPCFLRDNLSTFLLPSATVPTTTTTTVSHISAKACVTFPSYGGMVTLNTTGADDGGYDVMRCSLRPQGQEGRVRAMGVQLNHCFVES